MRQNQGMQPSCSPRPPGCLHNPIACLLPRLPCVQPGVAALSQAQLSAAAMAVGQLNPALAGAYAANAMRVSVDKGRQTDLDHQFVAEDTTAKDHADEVMRRCEEVTKMLRKTLGKHTDGDRWGRGGGPVTGMLGSTTGCPGSMHRQAAGLKLMQAAGTGRTASSGSLWLAVQVPQVGAAIHASSMLFGPARRCLPCRRGTSRRPRDPRAPPPSPPPEQPLHTHAHMHITTATPPSQVWRHQ